MTSQSLKFIFFTQNENESIQTLFSLPTLFQNSEGEISNLMKGRKLPPISLTVITHHILK